MIETSNAYYKHRLHVGGNGKAALQRSMTKLLVVGLILLCRSPKNWFMQEFGVASPDEITFHANLTINKIEYKIQRILHECSLHIVFIKRVYYNDMTRALASVIFIIVIKRVSLKLNVMSTNVRFFLSHNTVKSI